MICTSGITQNGHCFRKPEEQLADLKNKAENIHISMGNLHHVQHKCVLQRMVQGFTLSLACEGGVGKRHLRPNKKLNLHKLL